MVPAGEPVRIIANLPYNVGTQLLVNWLLPKEWPPFWLSMTLMFQKEVGQRIVAEEGDNHYGRLGVLMRLAHGFGNGLRRPAAGLQPTA